jgi:arylsulfatase A-like enzyme
MPIMTRRQLLQVGGIGLLGLGLGFALPRLDQAVSALLEDLHVRGLLESTLVVVAGEFGRTPRIDRLQNIPGRDHWQRCYSGLLAGAGIRGGMIYGGSDRIGGYVAKDSPVSPEDFGATIYHALGVPPETRLGANGFSNPVSAGKPVLDLFS